MPSCLRENIRGLSQTSMKMENDNYYGIYGMAWITHNQCMDDRPQCFYCGISGTVCTVEHCTVNYIANAKAVSILIVRWALWRDSGITEGVPRGDRSPTYAWGLFRLESSALFLPWWWCKIMALKKFPSRIEPRSISSNTSALTFIFENANHYWDKLSDTLRIQHWYGEISE